MHYIDYPYQNMHNKQPPGSFCQRPVNLTIPSPVKMTNFGSMKTANTQNDFIYCLIYLIRYSTVCLTNGAISLHPLNLPLVKIKPFGNTRACQCSREIIPFIKQLSRHMLISLFYLADYLLLFIAYCNWLFLMG